jgi:carbonic anhydrase
MLNIISAYASTYKKPFPLAAMREKVKAVNGRAVIILSCSDPRVVPADFLGVKTGGM